MHKELHLQDISRSLRVVPQFRPEDFAGFEVCWLPTLFCNGATVRFEKRIRTSCTAMFGVKNCWRVTTPSLGVRSNG